MATIANSLWFASGLTAARTFRRALANPRDAQERWLRAQLARHASSEFGRTHGFRSIRHPADFAEAVPLADYESLEPYIRRVRAGERDILISARVTHLVPTSGSTGAAKLIPFSASLQEGFSSAVRAWMADLVRQRPALVGGPSYWSISPLADAPPSSPSHAASVTSHEHAVPVGFSDDADYVGGSTAWLVRRGLAVPPEIRHVRDVTAFWRLTLLALLRCRDLRLISIWHPSFIDLLVAEADPAWPDLIEAIATGQCPWEDQLPRPKQGRWRAPPDEARARELRRIGPSEWPQWWPNLQVLSCWGEQAAEAGWRRLVARLPHVLVQPKGLLATEAAVTIPWRGATPVAVTSHYFEFIDQHGDVVGLHQVVRGETYEIVVTNGGGLWRYRLGDMVECTGHVSATPSLRFLGRAGRVSDLRGEKISEAFAAGVLRSVLDRNRPPAYAALRARETNGHTGYELLIASDQSPASDAELAMRAEQALAANPHYALARRLGQLTAVRVVRVDDRVAIDQLRAAPGRLGDVKPAVLITETSQ